jgi:hypothetical protein
LVATPANERPLPVVIASRGDYGSSGCVHLTDDTEYVVGCPTVTCHSNAIAPVTSGEGAVAS